MKHRLLLAGIVLLGACAPTPEPATEAGPSVAQAIESADQVEAAPPVDEHTSAEADPVTTTLAQAPAEPVASGCAQGAEMRIPASREDTYRVVGWIEHAGGRTAIDETEVVRTDAQDDRVVIVTTVDGEQTAARTIIRREHAYHLTYTLDSIGSDHVEVIPGQDAIWFPTCAAPGMTWKWSAPTTNGQATEEVERLVLEGDASTTITNRRTTITTKAGTTLYHDDVTERRDHNTGAVISETISGGGTYNQAAYTFNLERTRTREQ